MAIDPELESDYKAANQALRSVELALDHLGQISIELDAMEGGPLSAEQVADAGRAVSELDTMLLRLHRGAKKLFAREEAKTAAVARESVAALDLQQNQEVQALRAESAAKPAGATARAAPRSTSTSSGNGAASGPAKCSCASSSAPAGCPSRTPPGAAA